jgi:hypothetical protein
LGGVSYTFFKAKQERKSNTRHEQHDTTERASTPAITRVFTGRRPNQHAAKQRTAAIGGASGLQEILEQEVTDVLGRERYERRAADERGYRNGYELGHIRIAEGEIEVRVPQVRCGGYFRHPALFSPDFAH